MNVFLKMSIMLIATLSSFTLLASGQSATDHSSQYVDFQSSETGICVTVPSDMKIVKHDETILHLQSPSVVLTLHPLLTENLTPDAMAKGMTDTAAAAGFDIATMDLDNLENHTVKMMIYNGKNADGVVLGVGVIQPKDNENIAFLMTLTYADGIADMAAGTILNSLEFNPSIIE